MPIYQTKGVLTGTIEAENVADAQHYLHFMGDEPANMQQYLDAPLKEIVLSLVWDLEGNGHDYRITAVTSRDLTDDELRVLSLECSGQNSDGLGEGFEQQDFCWSTDDCGDCDGCENGYSCDDDGGHMISFDWQTNELPWSKIA